MAGEHDRPLLRQVTDDLVLVEVGGRRVLASAACPHRGGRLLFGHVNRRTLRISCPLHHSTFDLVSGDRIAGPACDPLRIVEVLPDDVDATATVEALRRAGAEPPEAPDAPTVAGPPARTGDQR